MKTIQEYREISAKRKGYTDWLDVLKANGQAPGLITNVFDAITRDYAREVAKESLSLFYKNLPDDFEMSQKGWANFKKALRNPHNIPKI